MNTTATEITKDMKRQSRDQVSRLGQNIKEMESLMRDMKESADMIEEHGICAMRGVSQRGTADHMARVAAQMSKAAAMLTMLADLQEYSEA